MNPNVWMEEEPTFPPEGDTVHNARVDTGRMKGVTCPSCGVVHEAWTGASENAREVVMPEPGSIIICSECGTINELTEEHTLQKANLDELAKVLSESSDMAQKLFEALLKMVHLRNTKKVLEELRSQYKKWCNDPDVAFAKAQFGVELPPGAKLAILTEDDMIEAYKYMVQNGVDHIGKLRKQDIEEAFAAAGRSLT